MTQYNSLNVKLSNSQVNKLKSAIRNETEVVLRLSSNMIGDNETNFPHKLLLTDRSVFVIFSNIQIYIQIFINFLWVTHQLTLSYQKPNYQRW